MVSSHGPAPQKHYILLTIIRHMRIQRQLIAGLCLIKLKIFIFQQILFLPKLKFHDNLLLQFS